MTILAGKYEIQGTLGQGATGTVYLAIQRDLGRQVAIKELSPALAADPVFLERFRAEAQVMARLENPNVVKVFELVEEAGRAYLVTEYVRGASLRRVMNQAGRLTPEQALGVAKGGLYGLGYAHSVGVVHRDVKPENVIADEQGVSKLVDFGLAVINPGPGAAGGLPAGTPAYMSPEAVRGLPIDHRSDIYSAGAMLYEMVTGRPLFTADSAVAVMRMQAEIPAPDARTIDPNVAEGVALMLARALAKDPAQRQQSAADFLQELETAAAAGYGPDWERRSSIQALVGAALGTLGAIAAGAGGAAAAGQTAGAGAVGAGTAGTGPVVGGAGVAPPPGPGFAPAPGFGPPPAVGMPPASGFGPPPGPGPTTPAGVPAKPGGGGRKLLVGGIAGVLLLGLVGGGAFAYSQGVFGRKITPAAVVAGSSPSPSPETTPSPSPEASPSASPEASPAASPSPESSPSGSPGLVVDMSGPVVFYDDCAKSGGCLGVQSGSGSTGASPYAVRKSTSTFPECRRSQASVALFDAFDFTYQSGTDSVTVKVTWKATYPDGSTQTLPGVDSTVGPPSGSVGANSRAQAPAAPAYLHPNTPNQPTPAQAAFTLAWTDSRGPQSVTSPVFYWTCY
jgi:hypothetical protein